MRGKPPKHPYLHLVEGTRDQRKHGRGRKRVPVAGLVVKPAFLTGRSGELWDQYAPPLKRAGILCALDVHAFGAWCTLMAEFEANPGGMMSSRITQMRLWGASFGMDPTGRLRLPMQLEPPRDDPASKYFDDDPAA